MNRIAAGAKIGSGMSGYVRSVNVLGNEDMFPTEGYQFPPHMRQKITNSYRVSQDSPFFTSKSAPVVPTNNEQKVLSKSIDSIIKTERLCTRAAVNAIAFPTDGELRPLHSKIVNEAVLKERNAQLQIKEQLRIARMKDEAHWSEVEQNAAEESAKLLGKDIQKKKEQEKQLAAVYQKELTLHKQKKEEELEQDKAEAQKIYEIQQEENEREKRRLEAIKLENKKRLDEFKKTNSSLLQKKQKEQAIQREEAKKIQKEHEEDEERMAQREALVQKAREEKNYRRDRLILTQTKQLAELRANEEKKTNIAASQLETYYAQERLRKKRHDEQIKKEMKDAWRESLRNKDLKILEEKERTYQEDEKYMRNDDYDYLQDVEKQMKKKKMDTLRKMQEKQIEEKNAREQKELQERFAKNQNRLLFTDGENS